MKAPRQAVVGHEVGELLAGESRAEPTVLVVLLRQALQEPALTSLGQTPGAVAPKVVALPAPVAAGADLAGSIHGFNPPLSLAIKSLFETRGNVA